jgi:S1-C subfamily serine protease
MTSDRHVFPVQSVLAANRANDLAILKIDAQDLPTLPVARTPAPVGTNVGVMSHPNGQFYFYTSGVVSRYMRMRSAGRMVDAVAITADFARGSSGAPVLNDQGQVVAIVKSTDSVYYHESRTEQRDLQMVFKRCIPVKNLLQLIEPQS